MSENFWETDESIERYTKIYGLWDSEIRFIFKAVQDLNLKVSEIKILDLGCGGGRTTIPLYKMGFDITGLDISEKLINNLQKEEPKIKVEVGNAKNLNFKKETFDIVLFSHNSIDYLNSMEERSEAINEISRVLKKNGYFIFSSHYFNLLPSSLATIKNVIFNLKSWILNPKKGFFYEKMKNGQLVKTFYTDIEACQEELHNKGFKLIDYTNSINYSNYYLKDFLKSITTWETYYIFKKIK